MATKVPTSEPAPGLQEMDVTVVFAQGPRQLVVHSLRLPAGLAAFEVVARSGVLQALPRCDVDKLSLAVWGRKVDAHHIVSHGERLEILRPLRVDPKVARRERFAQQGARSAGLFAQRRAGAKAGY